MKRIAVAMLFLAAVMLSGAAGQDFPEPQDENLIFYVQRSVNSNTIVYTARLDAEGRLDRQMPVEVFWRRFNDEGEKRDLSSLERSFAFGVRAEPAPDEPGSFVMRVVSYPRRPALLRMVDGTPRLEGEVAGKPSRLKHAYLEVDETGRMPSVTRVDLYGYSLATGELVKESFTP